MSATRFTRAKSRKQSRSRLPSPPRAALQSLERRLCLSGSFDIDSDVFGYEGDAGTTNFTFNVTWNNPGSSDTFASVRIRTQDDTATVANHDYQPQDQFLTFVKAPFSTAPVTRTLTVPVVGDTKFEPDESFTVNLSDAGPNVAINTAQRRGTIHNEDYRAYIINATNGNDTIWITAQSADDCHVWINAPTPGVGAPTLVVVDANYIDISSLDGNDSVWIVNPSGGLLAPSSGIHFNSIPGGDRLEISGGAATSVTYSRGLTPDVATLTHVLGGVTQTLHIIAGAAPQLSLLDTVPADTFTFNASDDADSITLGNGATPGDDRLGLSAGPAGQVEFANKKNLVINSGISAADAGDAITLAFTDTPAGLSFITVNAGAGADIIHVTPSKSVEIDINGGAPAPPTHPGDTLNVDTAAAANPIVIWAVTPSGNQGSHIFDDRRQVNFTQIETGQFLPRVASTEFQFERAPHSIKYVFTEDIFASLAADDLLLTNLTSGTDVPTDQIELSIDPPNRTAVFTFVGDRRKGILPDANFRATLFSRGVNTHGGTSLDGDNNGLRGGDHLFHFYQLTGDANRDRTVEFADLVAVAQNYGRSRRTFSIGDFDYDDDCDFADLVLLAQRYNTSLPRESAAVPAADPVTAQAQPTRPTIFNPSIPIRPPAPRPLPRKTR